MDAAQDQLLGRTLSGRFQVTAYIGEGAMANVYRAVDLAAPEPHDVALKVMHPHLMIDRTFVSRFRREAKAAQRLEHPNSVRVLEHGVDDGVLYIAMELLAGRDLFETLVLERRLAEARAARILMQICDALSAAHAEGIIHRDLKPENIMLLDAEDRAEAPRVKVLDFGIAKMLERDLTSGSDHAGSSSAPSSSLPNSVLTTVGVVVGTPAYMSPEQCRGDAVDARSDLYACGVLLYQLLTGRLPFSGSTPIEIAMAQLQSAPPPPSLLLERLHPALEATILTALSKWPAQRQQSAAELKAELEQVLGELSEIASPIADAQGAARVAPPPKGAADEAEDVTTLASRVPDAPTGDLEHEPTRRSAVAPPPVVIATAAELAPSSGALATELGGAPPTVRDERPGRAMATAVTWLVLAAAVLLGAAFGAVAFWLSR